VRVPVLVENDHIQIARPFEGEPVFDEEAVLRPKRGRDGDHEWDGQAESVRAGDDKHRSGADQTMSFVPCEPPVDECRRACSECYIKKEAPLRGRREAWAREPEAWPARLQDA